MSVFLSPVREGEGGLRQSFAENTTVPGRNQCGSEVKVGGGGLKPMPLIAGKDNPGKCVKCANEDPEERPVC